MRTIRASEIGIYMFCRRAWSYRISGVQSLNVTDLALGTDVHARHGRSVFEAGFLRYLAYGFLLAALLLTVVHLTI